MTREGSSNFCGGLLVRSNIIYSLAAVFAALAHFAAVSAAFTLPVAAVAGQPAGVATVSVTQERSVRGVEEVIVEARRPL
jgi:hypothetical protein